VEKTPTSKILKTIQIEISKVSNDPANVRTHSKKNIDAIKASLKRFGQQKPIVIDSNNIVRAGNGTLEAAKELGWKYISVVISDLEPSELTAYAIADNRTAELAEWDLEALGEQLQSLENDLANIAYDDFSIPKPKMSPESATENITNEIVIICESEFDQEKLYEELIERGYECKLI